MKKDTFPGRWDISVAGHIGAGRRRGTAVREAEEELGIEVDEAALKSGFVGCLPAEMAGRGGCNCYEEVFVIAWDARDGFAPGAAEVDARSSGSASTRSRPRSRAPTKRSCPAPTATRSSSSPRAAGCATSTRRPRGEAACACIPTAWFESRL